MVTNKVFSKDEITSRYNINVERYLTTLDIEFKTLVEMCSDFVIPSVEEQLQLSLSLLSQVQSGSLNKSLGKRVGQLEDVLDRLLSHKEKLTDICESIASATGESAQVKILKEQGLPAANCLRAAADEAEVCVANEFWSLPKYRDLLFMNV